jgi:hypothetical protein
MVYEGPSKGCLTCRRRHIKVSPYIYLDFAQLTIESVIERDRNVKIVSGGLLPVLATRMTSIPC